MNVYIKVSNDNYELIEAMGDTVAELAEQLGMKPDTIYQIMSHAKKRGGNCLYKKVDIGDLDD